MPPIYSLGPGLTLVDRHRRYNRLVDNPAASVLQQAYLYKHLSLTLLVILLLRGAGSGNAHKVLEKAETTEKCAASSWATWPASIAHQRTLSDLTRFRVMLPTRANRNQARKAVERADAKA